MIRHHCPTATLARCRPNRHPGFALVLALSLMGFVLLLILSLTTLTQVELATTGHNQDREVARENARLGIFVALGKLQQTAGPDQRITARADILGDGQFDPQNQFWTGVWNTSNPTAAPVWLVSGNPDVATAHAGTPLVKPSIAPSTGAVRPAIIVPSVEIRQNGAHVGDYAFWISGENAKVALNTLESMQPVSTPLVKRRYAEFQNMAPDINYLTRQGYISPASDAFDLEAIRPLGQQLETAISNSQFTAVELTNGDAAFPEWRNAGFSHDATATAWTVLANPSAGGLKSNLLDTTLNDPLAKSATREFLNGYPNPLPAASAAKTPITTGEPYFSPRAIPTEIVLWMGIFHTWKDAKLRIRFHVQAEFWNPYSLPLIYPTDTGIDEHTHAPYDRALVVRFDNLPEITIRQYTKGHVAPTITEDLNDFSAYQSNDPDDIKRRDINSWIDVAPIALPDQPQLEPGEVYEVMEPNPTIQPEGLERDFGTVRWSDSKGTRPPDDAKIEIKAKHPTKGVTITIEDFQTGQAVFTIKNLKFSDFTIRKTFRDTKSTLAADSFSRPESLQYIKDDYTIAYHFRLESDESDPGVLKELLDGLDLRHPVLDANATFTDKKGVKHKVSDFIVPVSNNPADAAQLSLNTFSALDIHRDSTSRSHNQTEPVLTYDLPRADSDFVTLGALRHLPRWGKTATTLGNSTPDADNDIFDRFFVSDGTNRNPHLTYLDATATPDPAEVSAQSLVIGGFNINSTSVEAWAAFLSSRALIEDADGENVYARHLFARLPFYTAEHPQFETSSDKLKINKNKLPPVYQQGMRQLDPAKAKDQVLFIARGIVEHLQMRGAPYASVEEFLDAGVIQALLNSPETTDGGGINAQMMENSNVYITQGDIVAQHADVLTTRSDTFLIRSFGAARDPLSGDVTAKAWVEAVVRRKPTLLVAGDPQPNATALNPREFEIISWRWLDQSEVQ